MDECPHRQSDAGADSAGQDRSVYAFLAVFARARGHCADGRTRAGPDKRRHAEWLAANGDLANVLPREMLLAGGGVDRDLIGREARQATGGRDPRRILDPKLIVEVDPQCKVLEQAGLHIAAARDDGTEARFSGAR